MKTNHPKPPCFACAAHNISSLLKKELFSYAINPFYYIAAIIFCLFCSGGFFFAGQFFIEGKGTTSLAHFFLLMPYIASVLLPALCLNIKNRAFDFTLPYSARALFFSRAVAALVIFVLTILPTLFVPLCVMLFGNVDWGAVFTAYLGILFFAFAAASFCVFLSELIPNRAAYFSASVLILTAINMAHFLPTVVPLSDFANSLVRGISFAWHFDSAGKGVFDTRDFVFYLVCSALFLELAVFVCESRKGKNYFSLKSVPPVLSKEGVEKFSGKGRGVPPALNTITFLLILLFIGLNSTRIYKRIDFSRSKQYSLSAYTKNLISSAQEKIRITYYRSAELLELYPQIRDVGYFLQSIALENKNVSYAELAPSKRGEEKNLEQIGVRPYQIQSVKNNRVEYINTYSAVVIEYLEGAQIIPMCFSTNSLEFDLALRIDFLLNKTARKVYVFCGNGMDIQSEYKVSLQWLNLEGFETVPIEKIPGTENVAAFLSEADTSIPLVLYGTKALSQNDSAAIENFILRGGAAFIMTSPYSANINGGWEITQNEGDTFIPILEKWGVEFENALAADISNVRASFYSAPNKDDVQSQTEYQYVNYPLWINLLSQPNVPSGLQFFWASPIKILNENAEPLFFTSEASWVFLPDERNFQITGSLFHTNPFTIPKAAPSDDRARKGVSILGAKINGKITGLYNPLENAAPKIAIASGEYFLNDLILSLAGGEMGDYRNFNFLTTTLFELTGEAELAALKNSGGADTSLYKITDAEKVADAIRTTLAINFLFVPLVILAFMFVFFGIRKRAANCDTLSIAKSKSERV